MKQCRAEPVARVRRELQSRRQASRATIKSITDFGVFIGLSGGIDGLVHLSDISWDVAGEEAVRNFQKGQTSRSRGAGDRPRARAHLAGHQADGRRTRSRRIIAQQPEGQHRASASSAKSTPRGAIIDLPAAASRASCARPSSARDRVEDARSVLKVGDDGRSEVHGRRSQVALDFFVDQGEGSSESRAIRN
jgi:small subunit ribosomal protein S1